MTTPRRQVPAGRFAWHAGRELLVVQAGGGSPCWTRPGRARYKATIMEHAGNDGTGPEAG